MPARLAYLVQDLAGGVPVDNRNGNDPSSGGLHLLAADNFFLRPVAAFHEHVRKQAGNQVPRRGFIEDHHRVNAFEGREDFGAFLLGNHRPLASL